MVSTKEDKIWVIFFQHSLQQRIIFFLSSFLNSFAYRNLHMVRRWTVAKKKRASHTFMA